MFSIKNNILYFILFNTLVQIQSLIEVPAIEDNEIATTEAILRSTVNSMFSLLHLKRVKHKERIKEFAAIHNFFASITLQDHDNLKEIARLAKVKNIDNTSQLFITELNEVLNEDIKSNEATEEDITELIATFIKKLETLKQVYRFRTSNLDINKEVMKLMNRDTDLFGNITKGIQKPNRTDENITDDSEADEAFWRPSGRRIYQGHRVKIKRYPFMASVQFFKKFQCGGSIIKSDLVITAASCLQLAWNNRFFRENPAFLSVQVGCNFYEGGDENIPVQEVYFHPEYNPRNLMNNLALMRLTRILKFGRRVKKIKKIDFDRNPWPLPENIGAITVIGWGARTTTNILENPWTNRLGFAYLDFYPISLCKEVYSKDYVTSKNFCAGFFSKGGGACNRDVGGPGIANGILVGVVSFGSPNCGAPDAPTVFTKLGYYADWIENILELNIPEKQLKTTKRPPKLEYNLDENYLTSPAVKIKPLRMDEKPFGSIKDADSDALRTIDESLLFKEFITTMFNSAEVKEYMDEYDNPDDTNIATPDDTKIAIPAKPMAESVETSDVEIVSEPAIDRSPTGAGVVGVPVPGKPTEPEVRMVTTIEKFEVLPSSEEKATTPEDLMSYTALNDKEYERKVEQKIAKLIDDIDIQELLKTDSNETTLLEAAEKIEKETLVELNESEYSEESSSDEYAAYADYAPALNESIKLNDEGLSIPIVPYKDLTFRQNITGKTAVSGKIAGLRISYPVPESDKAHLFSTKNHYPYPKTKHHN